MRAILGLAAALMVLASPAHAGLSGTTGTAVYHFPDVATVYAGASTPPPFVVGTGEEAVIDVEGVTNIHLDFTDAALALVFNTTLASPTWSSAPFNGVFITGPGFSKISSISVDPSSTFGFTADRATVVGSTLRLDWNGISYVDGTKLNLTFSFVPEPAVWAMMLVGFGLTGVAVRRRRPTPVRAVA